MIYQYIYYLEVDVPHYIITSSFSHLGQHLQGYQR